MRVNVYAEEMTDQISVVTKSAEGRLLFGVRIMLHLPVTIQSASGSQAQIRGPFYHGTGKHDDDSSAVTFWFESIALAQVFADNVADVVSQYAPPPPPRPMYTSPSGVCPNCRRMYWNFQHSARDLSECNHLEGCCLFVAPPEVNPVSD